MKISNIVGRELIDEFEESVEAYRLSCINSLSEETQKKRVEQLRQIRACSDALCRRDNLPGTLASALGSLMRQTGHSLGEIAASCNVHKSTLALWLKGSVPTAKQRDRIRKIEDFFALPENTLISRVKQRPALLISPEDSPQTSFGKRMSRQVQDSNSNGRLWPKFEELEWQWRPFIDWKTDSTRESIGMPLHLYLSPWWRTKAPDQVGVKIKPWMVNSEGQVATSAGITYGHIATYLGWLRVHRGVSQLDAANLTWLLDWNLVREHCEWKRRRSGGISHSGIRDMLIQISSMTRPKSGYLWLHPHLAFQLPTSALLGGTHAADLSESELTSRWQGLCEEVHKKAKALHRMRFSAGSLVRSRDAAASVQPLLTKKEPLRALMEGIGAYRHAINQLPDGRNKWSGLRDSLLLNMLTANPLRASQYATMTYRSDNTGNLYRTGDAGWRIRFEASDFKNQRGAANARYDVAIPSQLWPEIVEYILDVRPHLHAADTCDFVFLPYRSCVSRSEQEVLKDGMWDSESMGQRLSIVGRRIFPELPGFGPHSCRHIVATDFLRRHPGQYTRLAKLLNDKLSTVLRVYAHESFDDTFDMTNAHYDEVHAGQ